MSEIKSWSAGTINNQNRNNSDKKKKNVLLIVLLLLAVTVLLHQLGYFRFPWEAEPTPVVAGDLFPGAGNAKEGYLSGMTSEEIKEQMQKMADASYFSFKINARPEFKNGKSAGDLRIENPSYNIYPMVVQIFLDDAKGNPTEDMIYDSGGIQPNHYIENDKLLKELKAGEYGATAYLYAYNPDTLEYQGKSAAKLIITVNN